MIYKIKVKISGVSKPPVWRRFLIPSDASFSDLRQVINTGIGWKQDRSYEFTDYPYDHVCIFDKGDFKQPLLITFNEEPTDYASKTPIGKYLNPSSEKMAYTYDLGDGWELVITLEDADVRDCSDPTHAHCIDGKGICPPLDCWGDFGYARLKEFINAHPQRAIRAALGEESKEELKEKFSDEYENHSLQQIRRLGLFFNVIDGKPDFTTIDLAEIERLVSDIKLHKIR